MLFNKVIFFIVLLLSISYSYASTPLTSNEFLENKLMVDTAISPNGKLLATIWYIDKYNSNIVTIQDLTKESRPVITTIKERITLPQAVYWPNDERLMMKLRIPKFLNDAKSKLKSDPANFNIYDFQTREVTVSVNHQGKDLVQFRSKTNGDLINKIRNFMIDDPDHILMEQYANGRNMLRKVNIYTGIGINVAGGGKNTIKFISDDKGIPQYRVDYLPVSKAYEIFKYTDQKWVTLEKLKLNNFKDELNGDYNTYDAALVNVNNEQLIYLKADSYTGYKEIISIDIKTKKETTLVSLTDQDVVSIFLSTKDSRVLGYEYIDNSVKRSVYFDKAKQDINEKVGQYFPHDNYQLFSNSDDETQWVIKSNGASEQAYYLYNNNSGKLELYSTAYKYRTTENLGVAAKVTYTARDGIKIPSYLLLPPTYEKNKTYPLIIFPHGGPHVRDYSTFNGLAQFLSTRGYIVMQPNFRGSTGYGKKFKELGYKQWGGTMQDDLEDGVKFLISKGYADKHKVCILGASYGGYAALMGVVKTPDLYKCAVSINGISDTKKLIKHKNFLLKYNQPALDFIKKAYGDINKDADYLAKNSPINYVEKIKSPVLILAGEEDNSVRVEQSLLFANALLKAGKDVEAYYSKWANHNLFRYSDCRKEGYKKIEKFLSKHLNTPLIEKPKEERFLKKKSFWQKENVTCLQDDVSF